MDHNGRLIINSLQNAFPIESRPFASVAVQLNLSEQTIIATLDNLLKSGFLSRFGPLFNAERMGGGITLAAMALPAADFERVAHVVNGFPEVAHNYARDHTLNMWFVLATETKEAIYQTLAAIEKQTGYPVFNMPKLEEYCLGFHVHMGAVGIDTVPLPDSASCSSQNQQETNICPPDDLDRAIITATQNGLPLLSEPYHAVAMGIGVAADEVMARMTTMLARGWIRRVGVVPNHYRLGLKANGMTVWNLPDACVRAKGLLVGSLGFVSHCYHRPRHLPDWPFNLFAMVHGQDNQAVATKVAKIQHILQPDVSGHTVIYSTRILKKSGLRLKIPVISP